MDYIEISVIVEPKEQGSDVLIAQLAELQFESFLETDLGFKAYIQAKEYNERQLNITFSFYTDFFKIKHTSTLIPKQNWNKEWENNFKPIDIDGVCYIRAPFHEEKRGFEYNIIIEPKMSFGTGHHHTTQLMIKKLLQLNIKNKTILDMGCGTGVLAIMASMKGANPITAIDIDQWSYENTNENLQKNNIKNVCVYKGDAQLINDKLFHTILANINKNILLADFKKYTTALEKSGNLIISGFFETDINELLDKALELGLTFVDKAVQDQWTLLHFTN
jgi:ribosomal protein L11 methyltransferase